MVDAEEHAFHSVPLEGLAMGIFVTSVVFFVLTTIVMILRVWIRLRTKCFGTDDWLMCVGWVSAAEPLCSRSSASNFRLGQITNLIQYSIAIWGTVVGVGAVDSRLNAAQMQEALKVCASWIAYYC